MSNTLISEDNYLLAQISTELEMMGCRWFDIGFSCFDILNRMEKWSLVVTEDGWMWFKIFDRTLKPIIELTDQNYIAVLNIVQK